MKKLRPSRLPLWRDADTVQLGSHPGAHVLRDVTAWQEALLDVLTTGAPDRMLAALAPSLSVTPAEVHRFVEAMADDLEPPTSASLRVSVELPAALPGDERTALLEGMSASGVHPSEIATWPQSAPAAPVVLVAHRLVSPGRTAQFMRDDTPHLPVELSGDHVRVGPMIVPGRTACVSCLHATRTDDDPAWPSVAAQLLHRQPVQTHPELIGQVGVLAGLLLRGAHRNESVDLRVGTTVRELTTHRPHARCLCRTLAARRRAS